MSCQGKPIEMKDLRTQEQKNLMAQLYPLLQAGIQKGATPFGGQLSQPPDPSMLAAMNMMMQMGGQGPYQFPGFQTGGYPPPQQPTLSPPPPPLLPGGGGNDSDVHDTTPGERARKKRDWEWGRRGYDPYAPWLSPR